MLKETHRCVHASEHLHEHNDEKLLFFFLLDELYIYKEQFVAQWQSLINEIHNKKRDL